MLGVKSAAVRYVCLVVAGVVAVMAWQASAPAAASARRTLSSTPTSIGLSAAVPVPLKKVGGRLFSRCTEWGAPNHPTPLPDDTIPSQSKGFKGERRCVSGLVTTTRGGLSAACVAGSSALPHGVYGSNECSSTNKSNQIEAMAQARAIARFNHSRGEVGVGNRPGTRASASGVSPDIQWEVVTKRPAASGYTYPRADIVMYDSSLPVPQTSTDQQQPTPEIIEVKGDWNDTPGNARTQAQDYADDFLLAGVPANLHSFAGADAYHDEFQVDRSGRSTACASDEQPVEQFNAIGDAEFDGVIMVSSEGIRCLQNQTSNTPGAVNRS